MSTEPEPTRPTMDPRRRRRLIRGSLIAVVVFVLLGVFIGPVFGGFLWYWLAVAAAIAGVNVWAQFGRGGFANYPTGDGDYQPEPATGLWRRRWIGNRRGQDEDG